MKILHVTLGFSPAYAWGGPVKIVHQNCRELVRRGHEVTVYCTNLLDKHSKIQPGTFERNVDGIRVVYFDTWLFSGWPGTLGPIWLPDLPSYLKREISSFDVVHQNGYRNLMMVPVSSAARRAGVPFVLQPHGTLQVIVNSMWVKQFYDRLIGRGELNGLSALIAGQETEKQQALSMGIPEDLIEIIENGRDLSEQRDMPAPGAFRSRYQIPPEKPLILFLARINRKKGTDMLIEAFQRLPMDALLVIAGPDDGQLQEVQELVAKYGLKERVLFTGLLAADEVMAAFQDADLYVLPCRTDTFPMAIVESCLAGTPMVLAEGCEIAHLIKGRVGDVTPFDPDAFAAAMHRLLTDREHYETYRRNCPQVMQDTFSLSAVVDKLEALYRRVSRKSAVMADVPKAAG